MSLYSMSNYIPNINGKLDTLSSPLLRELKNLPTDSKLPVNNIYLDEISYEKYGTEQLWWVLGYYNGISDPYISESITINIPSISDLEKLMLRTRIKNA